MLIERVPLAVSAGLLQRGESVEAREKGTFQADAVSREEDRRQKKEPKQSKPEERYEDAEFEHYDHDAVSVSESAPRLSIDLIA